ncbi:MAG: hypothetical protein HYX24_04330 [Candidatus Aenigmarchaeota archaeon]|nr:hypothetical protein [Candidatus Aenigmarchaeota archaeon]
MDFFIGQRSEAGRAVSLARELGWSSICILSGSGEEAMPSEPGIDIYRGILMEPKKQPELEEMVSRFRKSAEVLAVKGGDIDMNRASIEAGGIDLLVDPFTDYSDGMDYVMARLARRNRVMIGFAFSSLLHSARQKRADIFSGMLSVASLVRKYKTGFALGSFGLTAYDMRAPSEIMSFGRLLGFDDRQIKNAMACTVIRENRERLSSKWVMPGVERE